VTDDNNASVLKMNHNCLSLADSVDSCVIVECKLSVTSGDWTEGIYVFLSHLLAVNVCMCVCFKHLLEIV